MFLWVHLFYFRFLDIFVSVLLGKQKRKAEEKKNISWMATKVGRLWVSQVEEEEMGFKNINMHNEKIKLKTS